MTAFALSQCTQIKENISVEWLNSGMIWLPDTKSDDYCSTKGNTCGPEAQICVRPG